MTENKKIVRVTYKIVQTFKIPAGIDLEADDIDWEVEWNMLKISKDGKIIAEDIKPVWDARDIGEGEYWKRPDEEEIIDDDCGVYDKEDGDDKEDKGKDEDKEGEKAK
jgi:hypothetical protein